MNIHRYIYTRLSKDVSPTGKNGFQSAFLPGDVLANKDVLEIESHIHFPEGQHTASQTVVLYKQVKGQLFLILLCLRGLPEVKDEHGRGGTFLCEGFLIAEKDWRPMNSISELSDLVEGWRFKGLDDLLASPDVDLKKGKITDLDLEFTPGQGLRFDDVDDVPSPELLMAVYHVAHTQNRDLAVVLKGAPSEVTHTLEVCTTFMPDTLRSLVTWDDAYDGGKIFFSPMRIFGYSDLPPVTGRPALFEDNGKQVTWPDDEIKRFGQPDDPFAHWLLEVCVNPVRRPLLNAMYDLSQAMVSKSPKGPDMQSDPMFELVNKHAIAALFQSGLLPQLGERWVKQLGDVISIHDQLQCWMRGYPIGEITANLESGILSKNIAPEMIPEGPAPKIVAQGSASLKLLAAMWTLEIPAPSVLAEMSAEQVHGVLRLMLRRGAHNDLPLLPALAHFHLQLPALRDEPKIADNLKIYLAAKVPKPYADFTEALTASAMELDDYASLADGNTPWLRYLNRWFAHTGGESKSWKAVRKLAKTDDLSPYPVVKAFAEGEGMPRELERRGDGRSGLLQALIKVHGHKDAKLVKMGFSSSEISEIRGKGGVFGMIKRLFRRG